MIIREIELKNIRSHEHTILNLGPGTYLIEGDIGSGKTSILMAIEFALFGNSTPKFYRRLLRKGATEAYVRIKFEHKGKEYEIYRSLKKSGRGLSNDKNYIVEDGVMQTISPGDIQPKFLEILGIPYSSKAKSLPIVTYAIYTPQETMKSILIGKAEERIDIIRKIFRLDYYDNAVRNSKIVVSELKYEVGQMASGREQIDEKNEELKKLNEELDEKRKILKDLKMRENEKKIDGEEIKKKLDEMDRLREEYESMEKRKSAIEATIRQMIARKEELQREIDQLSALQTKLKELEGEAKKYVELQKEDEVLRSEMEKLNALRREISEKNGLLRTLQEDVAKEDELRKEIDEYQKKIEELKKRKAEIGDVENKIAELQKKIGELNEEYGAYLGKKREREKQLKEYRSLEGTCPVCRRPLTEEHKQKLILSTKSEINGIVGELGRIKKAKGAIEQEIYELKEREKELRGIDKEMVRYETALRRKKADLVELQRKKDRIEEVRSEIERIAGEIKPLKEKEERYRSIRKEMQELSGKYREYHTISGRVRRIDEAKRKLAEVREEIKKKEENLKSLKSKLPEIRYDAEAHRELREKWNKITAELAGILSNIKNAKREISEREEKIKEIKEKLVELEKRVRIAERKEEIMNWIDEKFVKQLQEIEKMRLASINNAFRVLFERWFYELLGEGDYSATINDAFSPEIRYEGYTMPVDTLSGGERTSVALAYRLALNTMVKRALGMEGSLLILDEPTDGFSKDQMYKMKDILEKMETEQVIIVSHETELRNLADTIIRVEKKNGKSEIRRI